MNLKLVKLFKTNDISAILKATHSNFSRNQKNDYKDKSKVWNLLQIFS